MTALKVLLCLALVVVSLDELDAKTSDCKNKVGRHVNITATKRPLVSDPSLAFVPLGQMEAIVLDIMAEHLNFTYQVAPPSDILSAGNQLPNGSWTGATGKLQRGEAEWSVSTAAPTLDKRHVTDNSVPVVFVDTSILIPFPHEDGKIVALFDAFRLDAWIGILVSFSCVIVAAWSLQRLTNESPDKTQDSLIFWIVHFISVWTTQGVTLRNTSPHFRLAMGISFLGIYLLSNFYTGAFTSLLSIPNFEAQIKSIEDLANSRTFKTLLIRGSSTDEYFMSTKDPTFKKIADQMTRFPQRRILNALTVKDISSIVRDNYALVIPKSSGESLIQTSYELNNKKCKVTLAEKTFFSRPQTFAFVKNSKLTCVIDYEILLLQQVGLLAYADQKSQISQNPCSIQNIKASRTSRPVKMTVHHLTGAFLLLAAGCSFSAVLFIIEVVVWNVQKKMAISNRVE